MHTFLEVLESKITPYQTVYPRSVKKVSDRPSLTSLLFFVLEGLGRGPIQQINSRLHNAGQ